MGLLGPSKEEEEALRAAQGQLHNNNLPSSQSIASSTNLTTVTTTDYESALEEPLSDVELPEDNTDRYAAANTTGNTTTAVHSSRSSVSTIKKADSEDEVPYSPKIAAHETTDDEAAEPIPLEKALSQQSLARSHRSFADNDSIYGPPTTQQHDYTRTQAEEYQIALQKTLSRRSVTRQSLLQQDEKALKDLTESKDSQQEEEVDPATLDWDGPDDKGNPKNWPKWKRWAITMITAMICLEVSFGSSLYVCGVTDIELKLHVSQELAISGLTFYLLGLAFGPALAAPLSELFGRRVVYVFSLPVSMLFTMGVGLSSHIREILVLRFFAGFFASPAMAVAGGTIADIWDFEMMGLAMAGFCLAPFMGPVLGPVIGGFVAEKEGWKWTMWVNLMFAGGILLPVLICPETYKPVLLKRRAKKRGIKLQKPKVGGLEFLKFIFFITLMTPMKMLAVEPIVMVFSIYTAFVFAVLFGFFEAFPIIFRGVYGMSLGVSGLAFLGVGVGLVLGTALYVVIDRYVFFKKNEDGSRGKRDDQNRLVVDAPETRLIIGKIGAIALPPSLFWLGWSSKESVHWMCPIVSGGLFGFGLILIFFSVILYFSMSYPPLSLASALAANNLLRYVLASVFPLFTVQMYERLHIDWASSLFAFIALAMVPVPWVFEKWGPQLRTRSYYGYAAMMRREQEENAKLEALQNEADEEFLSKEQQHTSSSESEQNEKVINRV